MLRKDQCSHCHRYLGDLSTGTYCSTKCEKDAAFKLRMEAIDNRLEATEPYQCAALFALFLVAAIVMVCA